MFQPMQCHLWSDPSCLAHERGGAVFETIEIFAETPHDQRALCRCRDCGQRYVRDFHEEVDWSGGEDGMYTTYVPVRHATDIEALRAASWQFGIMDFAPRLHADLPMGANERRVCWIVADDPHAPQPDRG